MSMNLYLEASIEATSKVGTHVMKKRFDLYQTPTEITKEAIRSADPKQVYIDWGLDLFEDNFKSHLEELRDFLEEHKDWDIEWYEL